MRYVSAHKLLNCRSWNTGYYYIVRAKHSFVNEKIKHLHPASIWRSDYRGTSWRLLKDIVHVGCDRLLPDVRGLTEKVRKANFTTTTYSSSRRRVSIWFSYRITRRFAFSPSRFICVLLSHFKIQFIGNTVLLLGESHCDREMFRDSITR